MRRRALTILELLIAFSLFFVIFGVAVSALRVLGRQAGSATETLNQTQAALLLLERIRLEISSIVLNPVALPILHQDHSFVITRPNGTSIDFVTELRKKDGSRERRLIRYQAATKKKDKPEEGLALSKTVWQFNYPGEWHDEIKFPPGWKTFAGPKIESECVSAEQFRSLGTIVDMQWIFCYPHLEQGGKILPLEPEGRVFFRVKLALRASGSTRILPFTTLVGVSEPDLSQGYSTCPCLFQPCFNPAKPDCGCCLSHPGGGDQK
jgi:hypothetical protein